MAYENTSLPEGTSLSESASLSEGTSLSEDTASGASHGAVSPGASSVVPPVASDGKTAACSFDPDDRRFSSVSRVYGSSGRERLWESHAVVVGIGGVGSWAAEALARSGVGTLTLIDLDHVAESNINRQVHALSSTLGAAKVEAMAARIRDISPAITLHLVDDFVEPGTEDALIPADADIIIDAIDAVAAKASLIAWCVAHKKPVIVCGAAGGRTDPLQLRTDDLARTTGDALLSAVRARLRQRFGFVRADGTVKVPKPSEGTGDGAGGGAAEAPGESGSRGTAGCAVEPQPPASQSRKRRESIFRQPHRFGVTAIYSPEQVAGTRPQGEGGGMPLACAGYGSLVTVTASMGLAAASRALGWLQESRPGAKP